LSPACCPRLTAVDPGLATALFWAGSEKPGGSSEFLRRSAERRSRDTAAPDQRWPADLNRAEFKKHFTCISESHKRDNSDKTPSGREKIGKIGIGFIAANEICNEMETDQQLIRC
jgi:hypothetical protein